MSLGSRRLTISQNDSRVYIPPWILPKGTAAELPVRLQGAENRSVQEMPGSIPPPLGLQQGSLGGRQSVLQVARQDKAAMPAWLVGASAHAMRRHSAVSSHAQASSASEVLAALNATLSGHAAAKQRPGKGVAEGLLSLIEASLSGQPDHQDLPIRTAVPQMMLLAPAPEQLHAAEGMSIDDLARIDDMRASAHAVQLRRASYSLPRQEHETRAEAWHADAHRHRIQIDSQEHSGVQQASHAASHQGSRAGPRDPAAFQMQHHATDIRQEVPRTAPTIMEQRRRSSQDNRDALEDGAPGAVRFANSTMAGGPAADVGPVSMQYSRPYERAYMLQKDFISPPHLERMQARWQHEPHLPASIQEAPLLG